jgi:hypothetical protein
LLIFQSYICANALVVTLVFDSSCILATTCNLLAVAAVAFNISPLSKTKSLVNNSTDVFAATDLTWNKLNTSLPLVSVNVIVSELPESFETIIELTTDALKSASLGAVYKTVTSVVVKSI